MFAGWGLHDTAPVHMFLRDLCDAVLAHLATANKASIHGLERDLSDFAKPQSLS